MKPDRFPLGLICGVLLSVAGYLAWANKSDWDTQPGIDIEPQTIEQRLHTEPYGDACWSNDRAWLEVNCHEFGTKV